MINKKLTKLSKKIIENSEILVYSDNMKSAKELLSLQKYLIKNPEQRFWQGLVNWAGFNTDENCILIGFTKKELKHFLSQSLLEYNEKIKEMCKDKKKHITYFQEENRNYNEALDDIITTLTYSSSQIRSKLEDNLTQDTNPKE